MAYELTLPILPNPGVTQTTTYLAANANTAVTVTGNLTLSAAQTLLTGFSAGGGVAKVQLGYTLGGTVLSGLSATSTGISLSVLKSGGTGIVYGFVSASTLTPVTSTVTFAIDFNDPNYYNTTVWLSSFQTTTKILSGGTTNSVIDNPIVSLTTANILTLPNTIIYGGLSSTNTQTFRTAGKQARLVQSEY